MSSAAWIKVRPPCVPLPTLFSSYTVGLALIKGPSLTPNLRYRNGRTSAQTARTAASDGQQLEQAQARGGGAGREQVSKAGQKGVCEWCLEVGLLVLISVRRDHHLFHQNNRSKPRRSKSTRRAPCRGRPRLISCFHRPRPVLRTRITCRRCLRTQAVQENSKAGSPWCQHRQVRRSWAIRACFCRMRTCSN